jgi:hypothetical protein
MPDIERVGKIVEIGQLVRNLEFLRLFRHWNTGKAYLPVDNKRHKYSSFTCVEGSIRRR